MNRLVFVDESGAKTNMTRLRARAKGGQRVNEHTPGGHWSTKTMLGSVRLDGSTTCMTIDGPTDTPVFRAYVEHLLVPSLNPGDIVVLDNLTPHKDPQAQTLIQNAGAALMPLPPYSPNLNPIEPMWSKVKSSLRTAKARNEHALNKAIAHAFQSISLKDIKGWFKHCGYIIC